MIIVIGHLTVDAPSRDGYVLGCAEVVAQVRHAPGCLDFAVSADVVEEGRVNIAERWETQVGAPS